MALIAVSFGAHAKSSVWCSSTTLALFQCLFREGHVGTFFILGIAIAIFPLFGVKHRKQSSKVLHESGETEILQGENFVIESCQLVQGRGAPRHLEPQDLLPLVALCRQANCTEPSDKFEEHLLAWSRRFPFVPTGAF